MNNYNPSFAVFFLLYFIDKREAKDWRLLSYSLELRHKRTRRSKKAAAEEAPVAAEAQVEAPVAETEAPATAE